MRLSAFLIKLQALHLFWRTPPVAPFVSLNMDSSSTCRSIYLTKAL